MKVNIIGKSSGYDEGLKVKHEEIWGINYFHPQLTAMFDMHLPGKNPRLQAQEREKCEAMEIPVYTLEDINAHHLMEYFDTCFFSSSVDWIMAYAIYSAVNEIHLWGIAMDDEDHYPYKCSLDFWCGMAKGRGVNVVVHGDDSRVMRTMNGMIYGLNVKQ